MTPPPTTKPSPKPFTYGDRVADLTLKQGDNRYRLNANIDPDDERLLKSIFLQKGAIQIVTANLIKTFCDVLRRLQITDFTKLDQFHVLLAGYSGYALSRRAVVRAVTGLDPGTEYDDQSGETAGDIGSCIQSLLEFLPGEFAECCRREIRRGATAQADGNGPKQLGEPGGPESVRSAIAGTTPSTADLPSEGAKGRGKAGRNARSGSSQRTTRKGRGQGE